jgi:GrpB-like predicted nucleotidyltransferase (UPF0157 family)
MDKPTIAPVVLSEYNAEWTLKYQAEKETIMSLIGEHVRSVEHVGSTAVQGMLAKPEIDILIGIDSLSDATPLISVLEEKQYLYYQRFEEFVPERRYFRKSEGIYPLVHIHMVELTSNFYKEHIVFRDALRSDSKLRERYAELKRLLVKEGGGDRMKYNKEHFVHGVLDDLRKDGKL